jgi:hypothetical protein
MPKLKITGPYRTDGLRHDEYAALRDALRWHGLNPDMPLHVAADVASHIVDGLVAKRVSELVNRTPAELARASSLLKSNLIEASKRNETRPYRIAEKSPLRSTA